METHLRQVKASDITSSGNHVGRQFLDLLNKYGERILSPQEKDDLIFFMFNLLRQTHIPYVIASSDDYYYTKIFGFIICYKNEKNLMVQHCFSKNETLNCIEIVAISRRLMDIHGCDKVVARDVRKGFMKELVKGKPACDMEHIKSALTLTNKGFSLSICLSAPELIQIERGGANG